MAYYSVAHVQIVWDTFFFWIIEYEGVIKWGVKYGKINYLEYYEKKI